MNVGKQIGKELGAMGPHGLVAKILFVATALSGGALAWFLSLDALGRLYELMTKAAPEQARGLVDVAPRIAFSGFGVLAGAALASYFTHFLKCLAARWNKLDQANKVTTFVGVVLGLIVATPLLNFLSTTEVNRGALVLFVLGIGVVSAATAVYALQSMSDVLPWAPKGPAKRTGIKIFDTNVIIDGRIYDVARSGFLEGQLYVPGFVLEELQYIADSHDPLRRQRGKRGLDVLRHLQADFPLEVRIHDKFAPEQGDDVDSRLVRLARALGGDLVTNDHNLNRVATLQDVRVLNLNDLSLSLRPNVLPQEKLSINILREGNQIGQGIGYLDDGTMVVVENGKGYIGETRDVLVTQVIQTERGKLIFAEVEGGEPTEAPRRRTGTRRPV